MSADNYIKIFKDHRGFVVDEADVETGERIVKIGAYKSLEEAIKAANKYQDNNEVEYGLDIRL